MRIAFVSSILHHAWGGADALWTCAAEKAIARGDRVLLAVSEIVAEHPRVRAIVATGAKLMIRPRSDRPVPLAMRAWRKAHRTFGQRDPEVIRLDRFAPDIVIFSGGGTYDPILELPICDWLKASNTRYRVIANFQNEHPTLPENDRTRLREILAAADRLYFVSPRNLAITRRHLVHPLPNAECIHGVMVHNAMPAAAVPWPASESWGFATIARLEAVKGIDLLIHALAAGLGSEPGWHLNIYGRGQQEPYLREVTRAARLSERVTVHGFVESLETAWQTNHLLVSSAVDEGIPMTIPEAMLHGRAVLATRVGAAEEWIEHGRSGFLCAAPTVELLAQSLGAAWESRDQWQTMGAAAVASARARYRPDDYLKIIRPLA